MRSLFLPLIILSASACSLEDTPAQLRAQAYQHDMPISSVVIPGADFSDDATKAAAVHFCGTTKDCEDTFRVSRDKLVVAYASDIRRQNAILKLIADERDGQFVNWHTSFERYDAKYNQVPERLFPGWRYPFSSTSTVSCTLSSGDGTYISTCTSSIY